MDLSYIGTVLRHASVMLDVDALPALAALASARKVLSHAGRVRPPTQRDRRPDDAELAILFAHWERKREGIPMRRLVLFAICTAMRQSEIARIRWETYDKDTRTVLIPSRKHPTRKGTNHQRVPLLTGPVTIAGQVYSPIELMHEQVTRKGRVFPYNPRSVSASMTRATRACHVPDLTFHDLRHDAVSRMFEYGLSIEQVALCSGHHSWQQLKRYTNIRPETLHRD
jgi:integrase